MVVYTRLSTTNLIASSIIVHIRTMTRTWVCPLRTTRTIQSIVEQCYTVLFTHSEHRFVHVQLVSLAKTWKAKYAYMNGDVCNFHSQSSLNLTQLCNSRSRRWGVVYMILQRRSNLHPSVRNGIVDSRLRWLLIPSSSYVVVVLSSHQ